MEASYPVDRVTRFAGTNKRSVYMEPSYSALICSIHCGYMKYLNLAAKVRNYKKHYKQLNLFLKNQQIFYQRYRK